MMYYKKTLIVLTIILGLLISLQSMADEPTITVPYTEEQMCKAFLKAEICDMTRVEQEQYFLDMFQGLLDREFNKEQEVETMEICFKETEEGKLIPCKGMDI